MKLSAVHNQKIFGGIPLRIEHPKIRNAQDALKQWELLKSAHYLDAHSDLSQPYNKQIRLHNYSFLDMLKNYADKSEFVSKYCAFTLFPSLRKTSEKIDETFEKCLHDISADLNSKFNTEAYNVVDFGYDPTCSVALKKAFPGSDLDKGYIILEGNYLGKGDDEVVWNFTGELWNNLDQRVVSLNHPDTFPNIYTKNQVIEALDIADRYTKNLHANKLSRGLLNFFLGDVGDILYDAKRMGKYLDLKVSDNTDPYTAALFNRELAKTLPADKKEFMKNFAFFIEAVESNLGKDAEAKNDYMFERIRHSPFVMSSNVNQTFAWQERIKDGYLKSKLKLREKLERDFDHMTMEERFELVKDIIKSSSNDQSNPKFARFFHNDDDIKERYRALLSSLK